MKRYWVSPTRTPSSFVTSL